ncbi:FAD-dependent monooxygenase [Actinoplanes sp. CA-051413]|uniref:FAD-dependent monooxygenase n=1 Tax=Actinoplanes sp. CA-051413 TaxID=3239899 RepID=UPI003D9712D8
MNRTVIIVGAGPTGLMLAGELRVAGVPVVVLDTLPEAVPFSRSLFVQNRTVEALRMRGLDWFADAPRWLRYNFGFLNLPRLRDDSEFVPRHAPQQEFERLLAERAEQLGVDVRRGHEVVGLVQDEAAAHVTVRSAAGTYQLSAPFVVGCDGGRSTVRKLAAVDFPGTASTLHGITSYLSLPDNRLPDGPQAAIHPGGIVAIAELEPGRFRATCIEFDRAMPDRDTPPTLDDLLTGVRRVSGQELAVTEAHWISRFGNATRLAANYRQGRVLLAGDAAHIHFASAAQGLNTGIQDAVNLGWKLAAEVNGWAPEDLLDSYHRERHPVGARVCMYSQAQVAMYHPVDKVAPLRGLFGKLMTLDSVRDHLLGLATGMDIRYPDDTGAGHPSVGLRMPDAPLTTAAGATTIYGGLHDGAGLLLDLTGRDDEGAGADGWADRVRHVRAEPVATVEARRVLVRPDGYVAYAEAGEPDDDALRAALTRWFGQPRAGSIARGGVTAGSSAG